MANYLKGLQCTRCEKMYSAESLQNLCSCGAPLFARYDLSEISRVVARNDLGFRVHSLWRFKELLPVMQSENVVSLFEGFTPLMRSQKVGPDMGLRSLWFKDESFNPTGSFKARGLSVAVSKAKELGVREIALPTAGNAGGAAAAYAARGGLGCHVFMPADTPAAFAQECRMLGADVRMVDGFITDAGAAMQDELHEKGWFNVSTLKEPYRVEGKKTILFELAQQLSWHLPDVIVFPTGGGTGIVGAWKACAELKELGWIARYRMPRLIAVQASGCAPIVRAWAEGLDHASEWKNPSTIASGLRVPRAIADFLILRAIRESNGGAVAVPEDAIRREWQELGEKEGLFVAPEAAAGLAAVRELTKKAEIQEDENVVLLITGSGLKYAI